MLHNLTLSISSLSDDADPDEKEDDGDEQNHYEKWKIKEKISGQSLSFSKGKTEWIYVVGRG